MDFNNKKSSNSKPRGAFKKKAFNLAFSPQEILTNPDRPVWLHESPHTVDLVFLDFETTGGNPSNSSIIEIGAIKYSQGVEVGRFETLIKPRHHISHIVQKLTGISNKTVENAPKFEDVAEKFFEFLGNSVLVAHGALGDIAFVYHHYKEMCDKDFANYYFCTHLLVSNFLPNIPSKTLSGVAQYFDIAHIPAHTAMNDAQLTCHVFWKICKVFERHGLKQCVDFLKVQADNETLKKLGPGINPKLSDIVPTSPGLVYLTNPEQEISFVTASQNIRKTYHKFTEVSADRELNKIIVHVEGFKYERTNHFLDALLKESQQLKKISLNIDPRKLQNRSENFVQVFIPDDLYEHALNYQGPFSLELPYQHSYFFADEEDDNYVHKEHVHEANNFLLSFDKSAAKIPIVKTRKNLLSSHSQKLLLTRSRINNSAPIGSGNLKEGTGYFFGPFEKPREVAQWLEDMINLVPFHDATLGMDERMLYLRLFIAYLHHDLAREISNIKSFFLKLGSLKNIALWPTYIACLNKAKKLLLEDSLISTAQLSRSGLSVITNNELKELEVSVVVKGLIIKKVRLPVEQTDKLKSSRFFTRLFANDYERLKSVHTPIHFNEETCAGIELFNYWLENKRGEGEWIDFHEVEDLYDASILE